MKKLPVRIWVREIGGGAAEMGRFPQAPNAASWNFAAVRQIILDGSFR